MGNPISKANLSPRGQANCNCESELKITVKLEGKERLNYQLSTQGIDLYI